MVWCFYDILWMVGYILDGFYVMGPTIGSYMIFLWMDEFCIMFESWIYQNCCMDGCIFGWV